jgi:hypothetical protein
MAKTTNYMKIQELPFDGYVLGILHLDVYAPEEGTVLESIDSGNVLVKSHPDYSAEGFTYRGCTATWIHVATAAEAIDRNLS